MTIPDGLLTYRKPLHEYIRTYLKTNSFARVGTWGPDATRRLSEFASSGKAIRGSQALFSFVTFSKKKNVNEALPLACALELFHAAFLIHDDIMDGDAVRRGKPSMHAQVGESVALSIGDMAIFCGYDVLSHLGQELVSYISRELANVTVAQMHDVYPREEQTRDALLHTYTYKTARYTFSLPLAAGAILAGAPGETIAQLERLGESMGILFQIRDDELDGDVPSVLEKDLVVIRGKHKKVCMQILDTLEVSAESKQTLLDMLEFVQSRKV